MKNEGDRGTIFYHNGGAEAPLFFERCRVGEFGDRVNPADELQDGEL
jgi:hypothetical protein